MADDDDMKTVRKLRPAQTAVTVGTMLQQRYKVLERLGAGGMGEAWKAADHQRLVDGRPADVVIKLLPEDMRQSKEANDDIRKEYSRVWLLSHKHICKLFDMGEQDGIGCFQVMQYLPGITLRQWLRTRQGVLLPELVLHILQAAAEALDYAHTADTPVVHRDIKPENIMFHPETRRVHVIDFGLAAEIRNSHARYSRGQLPDGGTEAYMAPEQWQGREVTAFSDQWALGIVAWELLTGACPFRGSGMALGFAITTAPLPQLPRDLQRLQPVFDRVLQKEPDRRYGTCVEFVQELRVAVAAGSPPQPTATAPAPPLATVDEVLEQRTELQKGRVSGTTPPQPSGSHVNRGPASPAASVKPAEEDLASLVEKVLARVTAQQTQARGLLSQQRYAEAVAALEEVPEAQRHLLDASLYQECVALRDRAHSLDQEIKAAVLGAQFDGVREKIATLLKLQPWRTDLERLVKTLPAETAPALPTLLTAPFDARAAKAAQMALAKSLRQPEEWSNSVGMKFQPIPAGTFLMGSAEGEGRDNERPRHQVTITKPFWLGVHQVTQGQWQQVMGTTPWKGEPGTIEGTDVAASYVSWDDAVAFCEKLSRQEGKRYRLPTEAEWEYACRAGTTTAYSFGDDEQQLGAYAWFDGNAWSKGEKYAHRVGQKRPNAFGLYDVHGNVWEWCADWYDVGYYAKAPADDPAGPPAGSFRILRGGSWSGVPIDLRSSPRGCFAPGGLGDNIGCRVLCECG